MRKIMLFLMMLVGVQTSISAQSFEVQQLLLNVEKLTQFKQILSDMKEGYEILSKGYNAVKDISKGNFNLHKVFLDALFEVSPSVRKYKKVAEIIDMQWKLVKQYKKAFNQFKESGQFTIDEINYLSRVYSRLFDQSIQHLDDLAMVITAGKLRMSDDERLAAIDKICSEMEDKLAFLSDFNGKTGLLALSRSKESQDVQHMQKLYQP